MERSEIINRFNRLSLGDSLLQVMELKTGKAECRLEFDSAGVLANEGASKFEAVATFSPAALWLYGVRSISCDGRHYQLNSTVIDYGAVAGVSSEYVEFYLELTGGIDQDSFMAKLRFQAKGFELGPK